MLSHSIKRGSAELAVLTILENEPLHGYEIARRIEQQSGGALRFTLASLYPLLYRMEHRGWLRAAWETASNGRQRRCYRLTASGRKQLAPLRAEWRTFFRALQRLAGVSNA
ncbi:MAG: PadR family transcriptional regulator [Acidobacteria bacterium]|nr:PadR family transcriptional regulator [Acidobacteriota bacterium]